MIAPGLFDLRIVRVRVRASRLAKDATGGNNLRGGYRENVLSFVSRIKRHQ